MVNFRYHLVSITAVFLALTIGLVLGVAVVNSGAVDRLEGQLDAARASRAEDDQLRRDLQAWQQFGDKASPALLAGKLEGVPILLLAVRGIEDEPVEALQQALVDADAMVQGTLWLTSKLRLERQDDVEALASVLDVAPTSAAAVRSLALDRLAGELAGGRTAVGPRSSSTTALEPTTTLAPTSTTEPSQPRSALAALIAGGYLDAEGFAEGRLASSQPVMVGTRFVVASGEGADVADGDGAIPLVRGLVSATPGAVRVIAVEHGRSASGREPERRGLFIVPLRSSSGAIDSRVSTVNDIEDLRGRVAAVLALADLGLGRVGHYGTGPGADRAVPEAG